MRMTDWEWEEEYKPITNHITPGSGITFDTHGKDGDFVREVLKTNPGSIWTLVDCDGKTIICSGYHFVNRIAYYITEVPWNDDIEVYDEDEDEEIIYTSSFNKENK